MPTRKSLHPPSAQRAPSPPPTYVAIDFETADYGRDSACALALVRVRLAILHPTQAAYFRG